MFQFISLMQFNFDFIIIVNKQRIFLQPLKIKAKPDINLFFLTIFRLSLIPFSRIHLEQQLEPPRQFLPSCKKFGPSGNATAGFFSLLSYKFLRQSW